MSGATTTDTPAGDLERRGRALAADLRSWALHGGLPAALKDAALVDKLVTALSAAEQREARAVEALRAGQRELGGALVRKIRNLPEGDLCRVATEMATIATRALDRACEVIAASASRVTGGGEQP